MLNSKDAIKLLEKDLIYNKDDWKKYENRWLMHCYYVGEAAYRIGKEIGLTEEKCDYLRALGYVHDIGRKIEHSNHVLLGYKYLNDLGYTEDSFICLTHSFIDCQIELTAGPLPSNENYAFFQSFLDKHKLTLYDNIVQLCDLFCLETGFTTIEARLLDITKRKGAFPTSVRHLEKTIELKKKIEGYLGKDLYELFPEISEETFLNREKDYLDLVGLINNGKSLVK